MWRKRTAAAWCFAACVGYGSSAMWRQNSDALTHVHMHTYTLPHTLFSSINHGIFGSFRGGSEKPFQLQKDFFFFPAFSRWFIRHYYYRINPRLSLLHYCRLSVFLPPSHLSKVFFFLRWWRSRISHVDTVANPEFPQSASITESSGDAIKHFPWFTLLSLLRFVVIHGVWINVDELYNFLWDRYKNTSMGSLQHRAHTYW